MSSAPSRVEKLRLRLYVVSGAPNSNAARANLAAILATISPDDYSLELVDCIAEPKRALAEGVLVTPTLVKSAPAPAQIVVGTLADKPSVLAALGLNDIRVNDGDA